MSRNSQWDRRAPCATATGFVASLALAMLVPALILVARGADAAATPNPTISGPAALASGSVPVRLAISLNLSGLHPTATTGALECGTVAQTRDWVDAHRDSLIDYDSVYRWVLSTAHYYGQKALLEFPVASRGYTGTLTFSAALSPQALTDPTTRARFAPNPTVLVACWLSINGRPAVWDQGTGLQVVSSTNFTSVNQKPLVFVVADAGATSPISATGELNVRGLFFNPGPLGVAGNLQVAGPSVTASAPTPPGQGSTATRAGAALKAARPTGAPASTLNPGTALPSTASVPSVTGFGTSAAQNGIATAPPPVASSVVTPVPAVSGLIVVSANPASHNVSWLCAGGETRCTSNAAAGAPTFSYEVSMKGPGDASFLQVAPPLALQASQDCSNPHVACQNATALNVNLTAFVLPQTTFRVVRKDPTGAHVQAYGDFVYASPPQPQEPSGLTAIEPQYGQVRITWQPVVGAVAYRMFDTANNAPPARTTGTTMTFNPAVGSHTFKVATEYAAGYRTTNLPEATVLIHTMPPARQMPYLTKNNGGGSEALAKLHVYKNFKSDTVSLLDAAVARELVRWDDGKANYVFVTTLAKAIYANVTELGLGRSVGCWQWANLGYSAGNWITFCLAGNHGTPGQPLLPDGSALAAAGRGLGTSYGLIIVDSNEPGQFFANFVGTGDDPFNLHTGDWDWGWKSTPTTTLDSEGPKYTPNACLTCHGGTVDPPSGFVNGASLLPIDPGLVVFGNQPGYDRASQEESIRAINAMIAKSKPAPAVSDYINGLYNGNVATPGSTAQANYVPSAWSQQSDLFQAVVKPDCLMCHLATPPARNFGSAAGFFQNKAAIYADVCSAHVMPNAEIPYKRLWTSTWPLGNTQINLYGLMIGILGYTTCP